MNKKIIILLTAASILGVTVYCRTSCYKAKHTELMENSINYIKDGNYKEAVEILNEHSNNIEYKDLLKLALLCSDMEDALSAYDYRKAQKIIEEIKTKKHLDLVISKIEEADAKTTEMINHIDKFYVLEEKVTTLINNKSFKEAGELINDYKNKGLTEEKINKINEIIINGQEKNNTINKKLEDTKSIIENVHGIVEKYNN